ncbi:hypothetical protein [Saccharospirillum salsuginis]|uniref:Uncharacterized protein n=1 Tax=Saccharospirillum salsuginis TaxID=418750 RepID=A0A918NHI6_9GAMM|nr:hypothetical protein [Saccharospirillum salsuginis]GGX67647.1 hypothetical protein GCM10007392_39120 [Saccharospirillum salsuginis]
MPIDVTGAANSILPFNRQDPRPVDAPQTRTVPPNAETPAQPDVEVNTALGRREAANRALVDEASNLGAQAQDNRELIGRLQTERDRVAGGEDQGLSDTERQTLEEERGRLTEDTFAALRRIRENALEDPFGTGNFDAGALPDDGFFVRDPSQTLDNLDSAVSALERQTELIDNQVGELQEAFNSDRDNRLSDGNTPIVDDEEAFQAAAELEQQIREEAPFDINGLSQQDRSIVLGALQT